MFENRVLGRVLGPKRDEVTVDWRKLHSVTKSYSGDKIRNGGGGCVERVVREGGEKYIRVLVRKPRGTRPLGRLKRRWEDNIKMDLQEIGWESVVWIDLAGRGD